MNKQEKLPILRSDLESDNIFVNSIFRTIQGEGPFSGQPAIFIRLAGCNLQCKGCDTEYTESIPTRVGGVISVVERHHSASNVLPLIVITGGEPMRQDIAPLVNELIAKDYRVQIETNGTIYRREYGKEWYAQGNLTFVCAPKAGVNKNLRPFIYAWKYTIDSNVKINTERGLPVQVLDHDIGEAKLGYPDDDFLREHKDRVYILAMDPVGEKVEAARKLNNKYAMAVCQKYGYTYQRQLHKDAGIQ